MGTSVMGGQTGFVTDMQSEGKLGPFQALVRFHCDFRDVSRTKILMVQ